MGTKARANGIIYGASFGAAMAGAANPVPLAGDVAILIGAWGSMLLTLAGIYGERFDMSTFKQGALQALASVYLYLAGTLLFIGITKYTGVGTVPAMIANAILNFGFTMAVGYMYKDAWENNRTPSAADLEFALNDAAEDMKRIFSRKEMRKIVDIYNRSRKSGYSKKESIQKVLDYIFDDKYPR